MGEGRGGKEIITEDRRRISDERNSKLRVIYTNVDVLLSSIVEIRHYLKVNEPDVFCIAKIKFRKKIHKFLR